MARPEQTQGTVVSTAVGSGQSQYRGGSGGYYTRSSYYPEIVYRYTVDGREYQHNQFAQRLSLINRKSIIEGILTRYPVGSAVTVYYDPADPQQAFLQKGYGSATTRIVLAVVLITVIAIVALLVLTNGFSAVG